MLRQGRSCTAPQTVFQLTWCLRKTFLLTHKFGTAWAIEMTADREYSLICRADQRVLRWFGQVERMDECRIARRVLMAEVSGRRVRGRPRLGWMDGVKVALGNRGGTVKAARQCAKDRKAWRALVYICNWMSFMRPFLLGPVFFRTALLCSGGYHMEKGGIPLHDVVGINCKKGRNYSKSRLRCQVNGLRGVSWWLYVLSDLTWLPLRGVERKSWYIIIPTQESHPVTDLLGENSRNPAKKQEKSVLKPYQIQ